MQYEEWDRLPPIGLTPAVMQALAALDAPGVPMRVTEVHRATVIVDDGEQEHLSARSPFASARLCTRRWRLGRARA